MSYPFQPVLPAPGSFNPLRIEPTLLWRSSNELSRNCQVPIDLTFLTLLGGVGIVAQGRYDVKMPYGASKPPSLNVLGVAGSGEGKSILIEKVTHPIHEEQRKQRREWRKRLDAYLGELEEWRTEVKVLTQAIYRKQTKGGIAEHERRLLQELHQRKPEPPREFRLIYQDTSPEALFLGMEKAIPTAALATDEAEIFFKGAMNRARGHISTLWSGGSALITRATKEDIVLDDARLMLLLMVQPGILQKYMETQGQQARGSGMLARFIVCAPPSFRGQRFYSLHTPQEQEAWKEAESRLATLTQENLILVQSPDTPREVLEFTQQGAACWIQVANEIEQQMGPGGYFEECPDHGSKLAENVARVAALIHIFEGYEGGIIPETVLMGMDICLYFSGHFRQVFMPPPQEEQDAYRLSEWFNELRQFNWRVMRYNDARQRAPRPLRDKKRLKNALDVLIARQQVWVFNHNRTRYIDLMPWQGPPDLSTL
ncbi:YfjI family protein [Franzmannia qiaohouensis]|uniref:YfjI family protein n=1 Tax=Franzmannia qiaohouensis TaxID=1329370 RepID=A0ABU1HCA7_9GAMM|nr:YfjI family protein [Halomonas qiaohouensis]MDR5905109.1 YfjI family protein [Halomonas qiaohouensis]